MLGIYQQASDEKKNKLNNMVKQLYVNECIICSSSKSQQEKLIKKIIGERDAKIS
jgi:phosphosulfolactate synthase (CoM biosynthesis protein A)